MLCKCQTGIPAPAAIAVDPAGRLDVFCGVFEADGPYAVKYRHVLFHPNGAYPGSAALSIVLYGIRNCDTVKKARAWLDGRQIAYIFHDYKTAGIEAERLQRWCGELGWETLLNRAGTTFRKLPEADRQGLDAGKAVTLMLAQPSMIKRPVLDLGKQRIVGFKPEIYERALTAN